MVMALFLTVALPVVAQSSPPRDRVSPLITIDPATQEAEWQKRIESTPGGVAAYLELARLQEARGAFTEAEGTLMRARQAVPANKDVFLALAHCYNLQGDFAKTMEMLNAVERLDPTDPSAPQIIATYYWEKAFKDQALLPADKYKYILAGIEATDRALALKPDYADALTYKNLLLRLRATQETDPVLKQQLMADADVLRRRAIELNKQNPVSRGQRGLGSPPPPPPDGAVRVGNGIKPPTKIKDVTPLYPPDAQAAKVQGVVIIEATIDREGNVTDARVLKSIPLLDDPAVAAVRQWKFTRTTVDGVPVPVIMVVTVKFSIP